VLQHQVGALPVGQGVDPRGLALAIRDAFMLRNAIYNKTDTLKPNQKLVPALPGPPVITPPA
jgi:hypothetical protein